MLLHTVYYISIRGFSISISVGYSAPKLDQQGLAFGYRDTNVLPAKCLGCCLLHNALSTTIDYKDGNKLQPRF